jgi:type IV pilus assembly protein PilF
MTSKLRQLLFIVFSLCVLHGCVTETTGGFNVKKSDQDALKDYLRLATGYLEQNDLPNSKRHLANATKLDANNSEVQAIWGLLYSREGEVKLADQSFQQALKLDPTNSKARNNYAAFLFASSRFEEAYKQLQQVVEDTKYDARSQAFENLGLAALRLERAQSAEESFKRALQLNPNQLRSSLELCSLLLAKKDTVQAQAYYLNYLTLGQFYNVPHNARSLWVGIQLEAAMGNKDKVRSYGKQLETSFAAAPELKLYKQLLETLK